MQTLDTSWDSVNPLSRFPLFESCDIDEAQDLIARNFSRHSLDIVARSQHLKTRYDGLFFNGTGLLCSAYGADVKVNPESDRYFFTQTTLSGHTRVSMGKQECQTSTGATVVVSPSTDYQMYFQRGSNRLIVMLEREKLEHKLSQRLNRELEQHLIFDLEMKAGAGQGSADAWWRTLAYLTSQLTLSNDLAQSDFFLQHASEMLISQLLEQQPHNYTELLHQDAVVTGPRHVRRAVDYIDEHPDQPISLGDLAAAVGVTARTLQKGFVRYLEMTPSEYVRAQRVRRVHRALQEAGPDQQVSQVLLANGVSSFGHFSRAYKQQYGCTPSETLQRALSKL